MQVKQTKDWARALVIGKLVLGKTSWFWSKGCAKFRIVWSCSCSVMSVSCIQRYSGSTIKFMKLFPPSKAQIFKK